jgi:hypothetical protein
VLQTLKLQVVAFLIQNALIFSFLELILKIWVINSKKKELKTMILDHL